MSPRTIRFVLAALAVLTLAGSGGAANAFPDATASARIDAEIRPNFGYLLHPPLRRHRYSNWRRGPVSRIPLGPPSCPDGGYPDNYGQCPTGGLPPQDTLRVDCSSSPAALSDALYQINGNGTLIVSGVCTESLSISGRVKIIGEGPPTFESGPNPIMPPIISPPAGAPCATVYEGGLLEFHNIIIKAENSRDRACIEASGADIALIHSELRYTGDRSAIAMDGGRLVISSGSKIVSNTLDAAVVADGVEARIEDSEIDSLGVGLDLTPAEYRASVIRNVGVLGFPIAPEVHQLADGGIVIHGALQTRPKIDIREVTVARFRTGIWIGKNVDATILQARIQHTSIGIAAESDVVVAESAIGAGDFGLYMSYPGRPQSRANLVFGTEYRPYYWDDRTTVAESDTWFFGKGPCDGYDGSWHCRQMSQLPIVLRDDIGLNQAPWGWHDQSYHEIVQLRPEKKCWRKRHHHDSCFPWKEILTFTAGAVFGYHLQ